MIGSAAFSADGVYRYLLRRKWGPSSLHVLFVMLNPSTAGAIADDPTIRRCIGFARSWGYDGLTVANLFALRATNPRELYSHADPIGAGNDPALELAAKAANEIVIAWGTHAARWPEHTQHVLGILEASRAPAVEERIVWCFGQTKDGHPRHPLYLAADTERKVYNAPLRGPR